MKKYIGCKIIGAEPMTKSEWFVNQGKELQARTCDYAEGYKVTYPDNYVSWSPKEVFESAYREITEGEIKLISRNYD